MHPSSDHKTDPWWDKPRFDAHGTVIATINKLQQQQSYTRDRHLANYRMYSDRPVKGFAPGESAIVDRGVRTLSDDGQPINAPPAVGQADLNGARSAVDTAHAKQVANRMRVQIVTTGGRWDLHTKARGMQRFLDGLWSEAGGHEEQDKQDLDSKIFGSGFLKIVECVKKNKKGVEEGSVTIQCQPSPEFDVDEDSCRTTPPRELFQTKYHAASVLKAKYATKENLKGRKTTVGQLKAEIEEAPRAKGSAEAVITNMVRVVEAIHLPSGPVVRSKNKKTGEEVLKTDGRHVICTENSTLVDEPWPWPDFGVVKQDWRKLPYEWWGQGIVEEARKLQNYISATIKNNERSHYFGSFPRWVKPATCEVPDAYIDNDDSENPPIWEYDGPSPPKLDAPNPVSADMMGYPAVLMEWLLNVLGVSSMEAKADVTGKDLSGKALQHISDMSTIRFADKERHKERCGVQAAKIALRTVRDMADRKIKIKAAYRGGPAGTNLDVLDWDKVSLHEEDYRIEPFPTSNLPREPGAKIAYVQQLVQMGWIDPAFAVSLIEMPDLDHATNVKLAAIRHIQWLCDQIVYEGKTAEDLPPDPIMDLPMAIQWARGTWLYAQQMGAPQDVLDRLGAWITDAKNVQKADQLAQLAEQQEMMALMAPPMPPGGAPPPGTDPTPPANLGALAGGLQPGAS